jgi:RecA/RadA recombinase
MERSSEPLSSALATLQTRWGSAAVRLGDGRPVGSAAAADREAPAVHGSLALAVLPDSHPGAPQPTPEAPVAGVISTGFPALDVILGPSGLPPEASVVVRGGPSSGKTTLALRCAAEAQAGGDIVAWLDLGRVFDPVEAVGRGVDLRWLLVIRPADVQEGLSLAGALLTGRSVGLLVVDLPARLRPRLADQLRRLAAHARRVGARLIVLEPASLAGPLQAALAESAGLRLELERQTWLRLGRDVVGQRTAVAVAKNRYGPPGRSVDLDIHYLAEGERAMATQQLVASQADAAAVPGPLGPEPAASPAAPAPRLVVV